MTTGPGAAASRVRIGWAACQALNYSRALDGNYGAMKTPTEEACSIFELANVLENIANDDGREVESYSTEELVREARHVLSLFNEGGTAQNDMLSSEDREERRDGMRQMRQLQAFIKKHGDSPTTGDLG